MAENRPAPTEFGCSEAPSMEFRADSDWNLGVLGNAGEFGDNENSVYGEKADIIFAGDDTNGDSTAIADDKSLSGSWDSL